MTWIVCSVFTGGIFVGVLFLALLIAAKDPEIRPPLPDEAENGRIQRRLASDSGERRIPNTETRTAEQSEGLWQVEC